MWSLGWRVTLAWASQSSPTRSSRPTIGCICTSITTVQYKLATLSSLERWYHLYCHLYYLIPSHSLIFNLQPYLSYLFIIIINFIEPSSYLISIANIVVIILFILSCKRWIKGRYVLPVSNVNRWHLCLTINSLTQI